MSAPSTEHADGLADTQSPAQADHTGGAHDNCAHSAAIDAMRAGRTDLRRRLVWTLVLTALFMLAEVVGGLLSNSLALLADAGHMLTDAGALALALFVAAWNVSRAHEPEAMHTRREAWAGAVNAGVLLVVSVWIVVEAILRLRSPEPVGTGLMMTVAVLGLLVNIAAVLILRPVVANSLNARGAYLHVLGDLFGSVGTIAAALIIQQTGYLPADPIASMLVCLLVLYAAWGLLRDSLRVLRPRAGG